MFRGAKIPVVETPNTNNYVEFAHETRRNQVWPFPGRGSLEPFL